MTHFSPAHRRPHQGPPVALRVAARAVLLAAVPLLHGVPLGCSQPAAPAAQAATSAHASHAPAQAASKDRASAAHAAAASPASQPASAASDAPAPVARGESLTPEQQELNARSFDQVWETVRDKHYDPTLSGIDWLAVRSELRPKAANATTIREARAAMEEMLARLHQSHFGIIPAAAYDDVAGKRRSRRAAEAPADAGPGDAGLALRIINDAAVVTRVTPGGAAAALGIKPGWVIESIDGEPVAEVLARVRGAIKFQEYVEAQLTFAVLGRVSGPAGTRVPLVLLDGSDSRRELTLTLAPSTAVRSKFGNLPEMYVQVESRTFSLRDALPQDVSGAVQRDGCAGYARFDAFLEPSVVMPALSAAVDQARACCGLVLDLRGNVGGLAAMGMGVGNLFVSEPDQKLGTMTTRSMTLNFVLKPRAEPYERPVAVLVDALSISTAEIVAAGLQDLHRARAFGVRSAGAALPSTVEKLPNGDGFQYAFADYVSVGGTRLEGRGCTPDEVVPLTRAGLLAGRDEQLEAALRWLASGPQGSGPSTSR